MRDTEAQSPSVAPFGRKAADPLAAARRPLRWLGRPLAYAGLAPLLSLLGAGTMLIAPRLLGPVAFGEFSLLSSLFQMLGKGDLGLSQMADRELAVRRGEPDAVNADRIIRARFVIGLATLAVLVPLMGGAALATGYFPLDDLVLAIVAGTAAMVANGPVSVFRAKALIWEFTAAALALQAGMTAPRLLGLLAGGVTGCFAAMAAWFTALAAILALPAIRAGGRSPILPLVRSALPLFAFSWLWLLYLLCNRWISAGLTSPEDFGQFAFGANLAFTAISLLGTIAQVRYPTLLADVGHGASGACASRIEREAVLLGLSLTILAAVAVPLVPSGIAFAFPGYGSAAGPTMVLAVSCVPLGLACWFVPVIIALSRAPVQDAFLTLGGGFVALALGMALGDALDGIAGQAWGCVAGALALLAGVFWAFRRLDVMGTVGAVRLGALAGVQVAILLAVVLAVAPARAGGPDGGDPARGWVLAFEERFDALRLWDAAGGTWQPFYAWGGRTNAGNQELQYYVDPRSGRDAPSLQQMEPLRIEADGLVISARPIPPDLAGEAGGLRYVSGMLTTARSFRFIYGYAEIEARIPKGKGTWPAFWLLPSAGGWPPEIDVMEVLGNDTAGYWATLHTGTETEHREVQGRVRAGDLSEGFHRYGLRWTSEEIAWYLDGRRVFATSTPRQLHVPMYLLVNLAIGGKWPGSPDAGTSFPAEFRIRRIRVFARPQSDVGIKP